MFKSTMKVSLASVVLAATLAACGGGGGSSSAIPVTGVTPPVGSPLGAPSSSPSTAPTGSPTAAPTTSPAAAQRAVAVAVQDARGTTVSSFGRHPLSGGSSVYALQGYDAQAWPNMILVGNAITWVASANVPVPEPMPSISAAPASQYQYVNGESIYGFPDSYTVQLNAPTGVSFVTVTYQDPVIGKLAGSVPVYTYDAARLSCYVASSIPTRIGIDYESTTDILAPTDPAHADVYVSGPECTQYNAGFYNGETAFTLYFPHGAIDVSAGLGDFHGLLTSSATGTSITNIAAASALGHTYLVTRRDGGKAALFVPNQPPVSDTVLVLAKKADVTGAFAF